MGRHNWDREGEGTRYSGKGRAARRSTSVADITPPPSPPFVPKDDEMNE